MPGFPVGRAREKQRISSRSPVVAKLARACLQGPPDRLAPETQLLDYLYHCTASKGAELQGGSAMLAALCSAAQRSMHALEAAGLPAMALEALCMAKAMCQGAPCSHMLVPLFVGWSCGAFSSHAGSGREPSCRNFNFKVGAAM